MDKVINGALVSLGATTVALVMCTLWAVGLQEYNIAKIERAQEAARVEAEEVRIILEGFGKP